MTVVVNTSIKPAATCGFSFFISAEYKEIQVIIKINVPQALLVWNGCDIAVTEAVHVGTPTAAIAVPIVIALIVIVIVIITVCFVLRRRKKP